MKKLLLLSFLISPAYAGLIVHTDYTGGNVITASGQNSNENTIVNEINGNLSNVNITASAAIEFSKMEGLTSNAVVTTNGSGVITTSSATMQGSLVVGTHLVVTSSITTGDIVFNNTSLDGIIGATNGGNGLAGRVGEVLMSSAGVTNFTLTTDWTELSTVTLTAGDWLVSANVFAENNGATWSSAQMGISVTAGDNTTGMTLGDNLMAHTFGNTSSVVTQVPLAVVMHRINVTTDTPVYLKYMAIYSAGTPRAYGRITAHRIR